MPVSENYLRLRLESHPDFPSLLCIVDTLGELNIPVNAFHTSKIELEKNTSPFLAHLNIGEGKVESFGSVKEAETKIKDFDKYWSKVVVVATPSKKYGNAEDAAHRREEKMSFFFMIAIVLLLSTSVVALAIFYNSPYFILLSVLNGAGIYIAHLIVRKELGISTKAGDKLCNLSGQSGCEAVLRSQGAGIFSWLRWSDVGAVYFTTSFLFVTVATLLQSAYSQQLFCLLSIASLVFQAYSIYYQYRIAKQWCALCLGVVAILFFSSMTALFFLDITTAFSKYLLQPALFFLLTTVIVYLSWKIVRVLIRKSISSFAHQIRHLTLKRNPSVFKSLINEQQERPGNYPEVNEAIRFGQTTAPIQIVMACNPYCMPCANAHHELDELYSSYLDKISVSIRFSLYQNDNRDGKVLAAREIIKAAAQKPHEAVKDWYTFFDLDKLRSLYDGQGPDTDKTIEKHIAWSREAGVQNTPTIFLNGRRLPAIYNWKDLKEIIKFELEL